MDKTRKATSWEEGNFVQVVLTPLKPPSPEPKEPETPTKLEVVRKRRKSLEGLPKPVAEGGLGGPWPPHGENFCMEVRGDPYEKG